MKFKRLVKFSKNGKQKKMLIASLTVVILVVAGVFLYTSFASFTNVKEFNVIQGKIPRAMKGDMVFAFLLDDEKTDKMPLKDTGYKYVDNAEACTNGATVSWDNEKWAPTVLNLTGPTVCNLKFSSIYESITVDGNTGKKFPERGDYFINMGCSNVTSASFNEDTWRPSVTGINDNSKCNPVFKSKNSVVTKITLDDAPLDAYPEKDTYRDPAVVCTDGAVGSWDHNNWKPIVSNVGANTTCEVKFTTSRLNGSDPVIKEGLVPVVIANNGTVTKSSESDVNWYDYDSSKWANAVLLTGSDTYSVGATIPENAIKGYFVWIPKYRYKLKSINTNNTSASAFDIEFNSDNTTNSNTECIAPNASGSNNSGSCAVGKWMTHPAFTSLGENVTGIWVGKFETTGSTSAPTVKPNVASLRSITGKVMYDTAWSFSRNLDSHMMKNTEWGAMAYLTNSKYGRGNTEVWINNYWNNSQTLTGCTASSVSASYTTTCATPYFNNVAVKEGSTTRNMSGIFDTSGGAWDMVMGNYNNTTSSSGFPTNLGISSKYYDKYTGENTSARILGDATQETYGWNRDYTNFVTSSDPWFIRGGNSHDTTNAGVFSFFYNNGGANYNWSFRLVLSPAA